MECIIVAKGPTCKFLKKDTHSNSTIVCINHACKLVDKPDYVFMNDIDALIGLDKTDLTNIQHFVIPEYPHMNFRPNPKINHKDFEQKLRELGYNGPISIYNLNTINNVKKNPDLIKIDPEGVTTSHTAILYMIKKFNCKKFTTYGFCKGKKYHEEFKYLNNIKEKRNDEKGFDDRRMKLMQTNLDKLISKYNIIVNLN